MKRGKSEPIRPDRPLVAPTIYHVVIVTLGDGDTWVWSVEGENTWERAKKLLSRFTSKPDSSGWVRSEDDAWAYRADEIRGVAIERRARATAE